MKKDIFDLTKRITKFKFYLGIATIIRTLKKVSATIIFLGVAWIIQQVSVSVHYILALIPIIIITSYLDRYISSTLALKMSAQLKLRTYEKFDAIAPSGLNDRVTTVITEDIDIFTEFCIETVVEWIATIITFLILAPLLVKSPLVFFFIIFIAMILIILPHRLVEPSDARRINLNRLFSKLDKLVIEGMLGKVYQPELEYLAKLDKVANNYDYYKYRIEQRPIALSNLYNFIANSALIVVLIICFFYRDVNTLYIFVVSFVILRSIQETLAKHSEYGAIFGASQRIMEILNLNLPVDYGTMSIDEEIFRLKFNEVSFGFNQPKLILNNMSFEIFPNEITAIVSPPNEDRVAIAKLMQRICNVDKGSIVINTTRVEDIALAELRKLVGWVSDDNYLFDGTIEENLRLARPDISFELMQLTAIRTGLDNFVQGLPQGYQTKIGQNGAMLSIGAKQRLALSQAIIFGTPILLVDETYIAHRVLKELKTNRTIIILASNLDSAKIADRIILLKEGKVQKVLTKQKPWR